jgi:hypothetical protein
MGGPRHPASPGRASFELERLELERGRLVVSGWWFGVRGLRFLRPALVVKGRKVLATLEHKPWATSSDGAWTAAFPWKEGAELDVGEVTLVVAPSVAVPLDREAVDDEVASPEPEPVDLPDPRQPLHDELHALERQLAELRETLAAAAEYEARERQLERAAAGEREAQLERAVAGERAAQFERGVGGEREAPSGRGAQLERAAAGEREAQVERRGGGEREAAGGRGAQVERAVAGEREAVGEREAQFEREAAGERAVVGEREAQLELGAAGEREALEEATAGGRRGPGAAQIAGDELVRAHAMAVLDRDRAHAQREEAVVDREAAVRARTRMEAERDEALAQREAAQAQREEAIAQRDDARRERDEFLLAHRALQGQRTSGWARAERMQPPAVTDAPPPAADEPTRPLPAPEPPRTIRGDRAQEPLGVRSVPGTDLRTQRERDRDEGFTEFGMRTIRILAVVAALTFIWLLVMILRAFFGI